jgi:hypothetical protein
MPGTISLHSPQFFDDPDKGSRVLRKTTVKRQQKCSG